jgi:transglutaminase-like putative cysteine protease
MLSPTSFKPLKILNALPRDTRDTLFLLLVIAWLLLPQVAHLPLWCSALALVVLVWRGFIAWTGRTLPNRWWLLVLLAVTIVATVISHQTLLGRDAGVTLLVVLLTLKTLELRARRDAFVVFFLGFFCLLSNSFYSQSLLVAVNTLISLLGLLTALINAHMPVGRPPLLAAARRAGWMTLLGMPIMVVLFLLFPRLPPLWGMPNDTMTGRSGLSTSMEVGNIAKLALDDSVAIRISFEDNRVPPRQDLYFRGPVLTNFDGRQWQPSRLGMASSLGVSANLKVFGAPLNYEVTLEPNNQPWLFLMEAATEPPQINGMQAQMQSDLQWLVNRPVTDLVRYKVQSYSDFQHGPSALVPALGLAMQSPAGYNPRTLALAKQIRSDPRYSNAGSAELVRLVMDKLRTGGYTYTLEPGVYGANSADEFWFDRKLGFCEHIASAFVLLMRALDVPARIVTGYQGGEQNSVDKFWVVRQSDAHAWAEVWHKGQGWVRVDPTSAVAPGRTGTFQRLTISQGVMAQTLGNLSPDLLRKLRAGWDAMNNGWNQWVLNYTQSKQLDLLKNLGFKSPSWEDLGYLLIGIVVGTSALSSAWMLYRRGKRDAWMRLLLKANKKLLQSDLDKHERTSSPRQLAEALKIQNGIVQPSLKAIYDWLIQLERQRYCRINETATPAQKKRELQILAHQFKQLQWPQAKPRLTRNPNQKTA